MVDDTGLVNIARLKEELRVTNYQLLDAIQSGKITLLLNASGLFAAPAERQLNGKYSVTGPSRQCENEFLFVATKYLRAFDKQDAVAMGFACTKQESKADQRITLKGGVKPLFELDDLYVSRQVADSLFDQSSPSKRRFDEGVRAAKNLLNLKHSEGKLINIDDFDKWMALRHVIGFIRERPKEYPECAKTQSKRSTGSTGEREPTLKRSLVGIKENEEIKAEYEQLILNN